MKLYKQHTTNLVKLILLAYPNAAEKFFSVFYLRAACYIS